MNTFQEPEWSKRAAEEFSKEYCARVDQLFVEGLRDSKNLENLTGHLQQCIDMTSTGYGFK